MDELLAGIKSQLEEQSATLKELKHENEALRKVVEQIQLDVNKTKETVPFDNSNTESKFLLSSSGRETSICSITKEPPGEYVPKKIRSMTVDDERKWVKARFEELKLQDNLKVERSIIPFENTIPKIISNLQLLEPLTCAITLANYSKSTLCNPLYYVVPNRGEKLRLPPMIDGGKIEAICFKGNRLLKTTCRFLCTFEIGTTALRLTVVCWNRDENCRLGIGFSTTNLSVDESLYDALIENSKLPDYWESPYDEWSKSPVEIFSSQGSFFVRGYMTPGSHSIVNIDFFESNVASKIAPVFNPVRDTSSNVPVTLGYLQKVSSLVGSSDGVNCLMEVVNGLNVSLKLRGCRSCKCSGMLAEVPPLGSVMFIATGKKDIEAAFAFEVEGTDLGLLVAIKVQGNENQFAAVFLNVADFMFDDALNELLDQTKWSLLLRQSFAYAKDGEQMYQIRNIRATLKMTDRQKSEVQIQLYTI